MTVLWSTSAHFRGSRVVVTAATKKKLGRPKGGGKRNVFSKRSRKKAQNEKKTYTLYHLLLWKPQPFISLRTSPSCSKQHLQQSSLCIFNKLPPSYTRI